ncbi:hypothetical protein NP233_g4720 [Leucocoprinus birnbaumii]|uniref:Carboxylic ester hydrolase n=1 Tax=Leucocoprinus birnbaumii TaxID=56174 RepID=A0AAD5VXV4_9AGAR|nr:hypothetical protein NP233_g4720 [Leucocoprinus birnbaumii]
MFPSILLASLALLATYGLAAPATTEVLPSSHKTPSSILCHFPVFRTRYRCPRSAKDNLNRKTALGNAQGVVDTGGAYRFVVKYADSQRWKPSKVASTWKLPSGASDATGLPLACPQPFMDSSEFSEDCLSMILYVPPTLTPTSSAPTLTWIHGGSFITGSATAAGLDGSKLAIATNSIVAVIQYRLGALGFMAPDGTTNLAVKDVVNALQFLQKVLPAFGGSPGKITIAGQSSGATMVRTLLAVPSASSLFRSAIIQSDPMNFGFLTSSVQQSLQGLFNGLISCAAQNASCLSSLAVDSILGSQTTLFNTAFQSIPVVGQAEPMRPVLDGSFITTSLDSTTPFPSVSKPILISTVAEEAGPTIYGGGFPGALTQSDLANALAFSLGQDRANAIVSSGFYPAAPDARTQLQSIGTDYMWRCSSWTFARNWANHGGKAFVGEYVVGATYPANDGISYCSQPGIFGTVPSPTVPQRSLEAEMQARYRAFLNTGNPNVPNLPTWNAAGSSGVSAILLGGSGSVPVGACTPSFWGQTVPYDYQFYAST